MPLWWVETARRPEVHTAPGYPLWKHVIWLATFAFTLTWFLPEGLRYIQHQATNYGNMWFGQPPLLLHWLGFFQTVVKLDNRLKLRTVFLWNLVAQDSDWRILLSTCCTTVSMVVQVAWLNPMHDHLLMLQYMHGICIIYLNTMCMCIT